MHKKPAQPAAGALLRKRAADLATADNHTKDKNAKDSWQHNESLEPKELAQLVGAEEAENKMDQPKQEKGQHPIGRDTRGLGDVVGDVLEPVSEDGT